ncbi:unnamed protein product [Trichobilharzia regenti]|nr:unnamed protein product [Trichobilharzia regenti]
MDNEILPGPSSRPIDGKSNSNVTVGKPESDGNQKVNEECNEKDSVGCSEYLNNVYVIQVPQNMKLENYKKEKMTELSDKFSTAVNTNKIVKSSDSNYSIIIWNLRESKKLDPAVRRADDLEVVSCIVLKYFLKNKWSSHKKSHQNR